MPAPSWLKAIQSIIPDWQTSGLPGGAQQVRDDTQFAIRNPDQTFNPEVATGIVGTTPTAKGTLFSGAKKKVDAIDDVLEQYLQRIRNVA